MTRSAMHRQTGPLLEDFSLILLNGKVPIEKGWQRGCGEKKALPPNVNGYNIGVCCGPASACLVLDVDDLAAFRIYCEKNGFEVPDTFSVETGSGGLHHYFRYPQDSGNYGNKAYKAQGFDIRGNGGQVVAPGSIHPDTGKPYRVVKDIPMAHPPQWLLNLYKEKPRPEAGHVQKARCDSIADLPIRAEAKSLVRFGASKGNRSEAMWTVLCELVRSSLSTVDIVSIFNQHPIGEKYLEKGASKERWLQQQIDKACSVVTDRATPGRRKTKEPSTKEASAPDAEPECYLEALTDLDDESGDDYEWLEEMLVPKGEPMVLGGKGGTGKTQLALELSARILESDPDFWVVYVCAEGTYRDTKIRGRKMGLTRFERFLFLKRKGGTTSFKLSEKEELALMTHTLKQAKAGGCRIVFVVIDSIRGMQKGSLNDDAVGEAMMAINAKVCEGLGATVCYIHHGRKNDQDLAAMDAMLGSVTIVNCVRHALFLRKRSDRTRTVEVCKSNLGFEDHWFTSELTPDNRIRLTHQGEMGGETGDEPVDQSQLGKAEMILLAQLGEGTPVRAATIYQLGERDGISADTMKKAKKLYVIDTFQKDRAWYWKMVLDENENPRSRASLR
jgi:hypothetical protein